jgi:hypothetical protein
MKKIILAMFTIISTSALAEVSYSMPALEVGFKWNSMDYNGSATNSSSQQSMGLQMGGSMVFNFTEQFGLRTGLFYAERPFKFSFGTLGDGSGKLTYIDIPVHFMFKFEDYAGIYIGPSFSTKLGEQCDQAGCSVTDAKSMIVPITFGAQFKFTPNLGLNLFFETVSGDISKDLKNSRGIGMNLLLAFD